MRLRKRIGLFVVAFVVTYWLISLAILLLS